MSAFFKLKVTMRFVTCCHSARSKRFIYFSLIPGRNEDTTVAEL